jgi:hypothetical protein
MLHENSHLSESDLILAADGELPARRRAEVAAHLETCWSCRERMEALKGTITGYVRARNAELNGQLLPEAGPRALLRARLREAGARGGTRKVLPMTRLAAAGAIFGAAILAVFIIFGSTVNAEGPKPRSGLTPGETRPITLDEVCRSADAEVVSSDIPEATREKVFAAYGIQSAWRDQFEVDYLITPDLGGTESIRNLWPQPYSARWNARVKDRLEQRLHQLVCSGKLDLPTAQRAIAVDWIGAYKRYVGGDASR